MIPLSTRETEARVPVQREPLEPLNWSPESTSAGRQALPWAVEQLPHNEQPSQKGM